MQQIKSGIGGAAFLVSKPSLDDLFTPEDFTSEHKMIGKTARQFLEKEIIPIKEEIENQDFDLIVKKLRKAGELGLLAHSIPQEYGGLGLDKITKAIVGEMIGPSSGYGVAHSNHTCIATLPITYFGTPEQKEKYLPKMASGEFLGAYCLTEPNAGSDALASQTTATLNGSGTHYILNGTKIYITNAVFSDTFIVYAKVDGTKFTAFIVEKDFPGLSLGPEEKKMGIKGSSTRSVILEDCLVPVENLLGEIGRGHVIALNVLNLGRFNLGSACMGAAKYSLKKVLQFTQERRQFNKRIADFPATKEKVARMASVIYASESVQYRTAGLLEDVLGGLYDSFDSKAAATSLSEYALECAICKVLGSETLDYSVDEALQLHGGAGFIKEYNIEQMYRDSRINRIFEGTNEINRLLIPTLFYRRVQKGEWNLEELVSASLRSLKERSVKDSGLLFKEREAVDTIRHLFIVSSGLALKAHGAELMEEQETLMRLADLAISLYGAESAVYRTLKAVQENGEEKEKIKMDLARSFLDEAMWEAERHTRILISQLAPDPDAEGLTKLVMKACCRFAPEGSAFKRNREIADHYFTEHEGAH
ncbi:acyl-CoA dehydrogenase family protein [Peribacillus kribbensis]|uniref:acyl-CoA dehydrogenase family protein n=1 Tax=Peribacillus kribbensis TaxID=356658 RepID=UPI00040D8438|nr:acyl-CoA dehydrogenase family protein [Peribacillus kribbensis]